MLNRSKQSPDLYTRATAGFVNYKIGPALSTVAGVFNIGVGIISIEDIEHHISKQNLLIVAFGITTTCLGMIPGINALRELIFTRDTIRFSYLMGDRT